MSLKSEMVHYSKHSLKDQSGTKHESSLPRTIYCMSASYCHYQGLLSFAGFVKISEGLTCMLQTVLRFIRYETQIACSIRFLDNVLSLIIIGYIIMYVQIVRLKGNTLKERIGR